MASPEQPFNITGSQDIEMQDLGPNAPSLQLTLQAEHHPSRESQTSKGLLHTMRTKLLNSVTPQPKAYELELFAAHKLQTKKARFLEDYVHLSHRPAPVAFLFHLIVKRIVQPPDVLDTIECYPRHETCLSDWIKSIHEALVVQSSDSVILWWGSDVSQH